MEKILWPPKLCSSPCSQLIIKLKSMLRGLLRSPFKYNSSRRVSPSTENASKFKQLPGHEEWRTPTPSKEWTSCKDTVFHAEKLCSHTCLKWVTYDRRLPEVHQGHADFGETNGEHWAHINAFSPTAQIQHFSEELEICDLPRNNKVIVVSF